jgi:F-type H+-transporting ATPase subunit a
MILPIFIASGVSMTASPIPEFGEWFTNSVLVAALVALVLVLFARAATARMRDVPEGKQNLFEALVEMLYDTFEGIVGKHMISRVFTMLATLFVFILVSNWCGLLPGIGTIGWGEKTGPLSIAAAETPLFRPPNADLNMTLAMALIFSVMWLWWSVRETGVIGFITHLFGPKGGLKGAMAFALLPIFIFVGLIEVVSIAFRPVSLSLRLYGNIYAGETLLHAMGALGDTLPDAVAFLMSVVIPLPFYFLELLVGLLQALVFTLLCAVYINLATTHDEEGHGAEPAH